MLTTTLSDVVPGNPDMGSLINTYSSTVANGNFGFPINQFRGANLDQPWIETGPSNQVYVAYNDIACRIWANCIGARLIGRWGKL